jgi:DNA-binding NarL/FixJ family response regulator
MIARLAGLAVTFFTVEKHVISIYRKFGVPDRTAFVAKALMQVQCE